MLTLAICPHPGFGEAAVLEDLGELCGRGSDYRFLHGGTVRMAEVECSIVRLCVVVFKLEKLGGKHDSIIFNLRPSR